MKPVISATDARLIGMYDHYHAKVQHDPRLYCYDDNRVHVYFPRSIVEFTDSASGHSGFDYGMRPFGISRWSHNSVKEVSEIFDSPESLAEFINTSDCRGVDVCANEYRREKLRRDFAEKTGRHVTEPNNNPVDKEFYKKYSWETMKSLTAKYGATVNNDWKVLTMNEFELRYGIDG